MTRIVILGDVGVRTDYHAGDEAMLESLLDALRQRHAELEVTVISANPVDSSTRYAVEAIERIGFDEERTPGRSLRETRLSQVTLAAQGRRDSLRTSDSVWPVIDAVASADAVVISGGGNLTTPFAEHVYERAALARIAEIFGRPLIVSGQSLGPELQPRDAELVAQILRSASLVGLREASSLATARRLAPESTSLVATVDDAAFLCDPVPTGEDLDLGLPEEYVVASFPPHAGPFDADDHLEAVASLLDHAAVVTGARVVLLPHQSTPPDAMTLPDVKDGDVAVGARLATLMTSTPLQLPQLNARQIAHVTRGAVLSISGRYHPVVFALSAGVPAIGVPVDAYTSQKITGALESFGAGQWVLDPFSLATADASNLVTRVWTERTASSAVLIARAGDAARLQNSWWDAVAAMLIGKRQDVERLVPVSAVNVGDKDLVARISRRARLLATMEQRLADAGALSIALDDLAKAREAEIIDLRLANVALEEQKSELIRRADALRLATASTKSADSGFRAEEDKGELERVLLEREAVEQHLFERERLVAVLGRRIHELESVTSAPPEELEGAHQAVRILQTRVAELEAQVADLLRSTSWRVSTPLRVAKNPRPYIRKLRSR